MPKLIRFASNRYDPGTPDGDYELVEALHSSQSVVAAVGVFEPKPSSSGGEWIESGEFTGVPAPSSILWPIGGLALVIGVMTGVGAVVFRALIAFVHNMSFNGRFSFVYNANIAEGLICHTYLPGDEAVQACRDGSDPGDQGGGRRVRPP